MSGGDTLLLYRDGPAPDVLLRWLDPFGDPLDLTAWTSWRVEFMDDDNVARLVKVAGVTGGDGTLPANAVVRFTAAELAAVPVGDYRMRVSAVAADGRRAYFPPPAPTVRLAAAATTPP